MSRLVSFIKAFLNLGRSVDPTDMYRRMGVKIGVNTKIQNEVMIDFSHFWHIEIGDNVTLAPRVHILAHDASTEKLVGHTKVANTSIGNNVFIGASSIILPGVHIEDNVIVGAGSVVTKNLKTGYVYAGNPAREIVGLKEFKSRITEQITDSKTFDSTYTLSKGVSEEKRLELVEVARENGFLFLK